MQDFNEQIVGLRPVLARFARQRLRNEAWAEDAVSEALVAALEKPQAFAGRSSVQTWLVGILHNKLVDQIRLHTRDYRLHSWPDRPESGHWPEAHPDSMDEAQADWGDPLESLERQQFMAQFDHCLKSLPARQGRAFMLRHWMEEETDDICSDLGVSANNLAVMLHRARTQLRATLQALWAPAPSGPQPQAQA